MWDWSSGKTDLGVRISRLENSAPYILRGGGIAATVSPYTSVPAAAINSGAIDLSSTGVQTVGSVPPFVNVSGFAATATTTSITWYWDGTNSSKVIVINRADKTQFTVPPSSIAITNLTANTWYGFLPFWTPSNVCGIGWMQGDSGTPQIAFAGGTGASFAAAASAYTLAQSNALQNSQGREALSTSFMTFQTPAAGTSSGSASGGGAAGRCVMLGTEIDPLGEIAPGDWRNIHEPCQDWWRIETKRGKGLNCTPNHPIYDADNGKKEASEFKTGDWIITDIGMEKIVSSHRFMRMCTKVHTQMKYGHLYWANGFLSSNAKQNYS